VTVDELTRRFEENREHLRRVAQRMLGSQNEADDAVQEAWLRVNRAGADGVENLGGWLTTVVARVCLDILRSRKSLREDPLDVVGDERPAADEEVLLADSIGPALLVLLDTLGPAERVAFVLHDLFAMPFEEIAVIVGRSPAATRQLASRARRRVQGGAASPEGNRARQQEIVGAFLAASRKGDFEALLSLLHPDAILSADPLAVQAATANLSRGAPNLAPEIRGAHAVAETLRGRAQGALPALIDGVPGAAWVLRGQTRAAFVYTVENDCITSIELVMEPARLAQLQITLSATE
jgi:RNA polymerase sigma-70 factor (ECF subfamily)